MSTTAERRIERGGWYSQHPLKPVRVHVVTREWFDEVARERDKAVAENQRLHEELQALAALVAECINAGHITAAALAGTPSEKPRGYSKADLLRDTMRPGTPSEDTE